MNTTAHHQTIEQRLRFLETTEPWELILLREEVPVLREEHDRRLSALETAAEQATPRSLAKRVKSLEIGFGYHQQSQPDWMSMAISEQVNPILAELGLANCRSASAARAALVEAGKVRPVLPDHERRIAELESRNAALEARLDRLTSQLMHPAGSKDD